MKTINLNKQQIIESIILLLGSDRARPDLINKITGVYSFKGINEGTKYKIDRIIKILIESEKDFNDRELKTIKEYSEELNMDVNCLFLQLQDGTELNLINKINEIRNTSIELNIEPFSFSNVSELTSNDEISYKFIYDNFTE